LLTSDRGADLVRICCYSHVILLPSLACTCHNTYLGEASTPHVFPLRSSCPPRGIRSCLHARYSRACERRRCMCDRSNIHELHPAPSSHDRRRDWPSLHRV